MVSRKKIAGTYIDSLDRYDETNYLDVLFTADGYDAASFSWATGEFSPINSAIGPARCTFSGGFAQRFIVKFYSVSPVSNNFYL